MNYDLRTLMDRHPISRIKRDRSIVLECLLKDAPKAPWAHLYGEKNVLLSEYTYEEALGLAVERAGASVVCYACFPDTILPGELWQVTDEADIHGAGGLIFMERDPGEEICYIKFNDERAPKWQLTTEIFSRDGKKRVRKVAACESAKKHLERILKNYELISDLYRDIELLPCEKEGDSVVFPYLEGESLLCGVDFSRDDREVLVRKITDATAGIFSFDERYVCGFRGTPEFFDMFGDFAVFDEGETSVDRCNLDCNYDNYVISDGQIYCYDYEWVTDFPVPIEFLRARMLRFLYDAHEGELLRLFRDRDDFMSAFGISRERALKYRRMEEHFQQTVHGSDFEYRYGLYYEGIPVTREPEFIPSEPGFGKRLRRYAKGILWPCIYKHRGIYGRWIRDFEKKLPQTNEGLNSDFVLLVDENRLAPGAIGEINRYISAHPKVDAIYSDEDIMDARGVRCEPHFKSDYNPDLLRSYNYIRRFLVVRRGLAEACESQDYAFILRVTREAKEIGHIAMVLYHEPIGGGRSYFGARDLAFYDKNTCDAGDELLALKEHDRIAGNDCEVFVDSVNPVRHSLWHIAGEPLVSVLIPNKDQHELLHRCVTSFEDRCRYRNTEFIIIENNSTSEEIFTEYDRLTLAYPNVRVIRYEGEFNFSLINNFGREHARGEYLLFLNNDTEYMAPDSLSEMMGLCQRGDTAIVGAQLWYEDLTIQHAGVVVGYRDVAGHCFAHQPYSDLGYENRIQSVCDYSAVTAAAMLMKASVFDEIGGFNPAYKVALNDVDLCLRTGALGYRIVYTPYARFFHYESVSRGDDLSEENKSRYERERSLFRSEYGDMLESGDPMYNVNLSRLWQDFSPRRKGEEAAYE